MTKLFAFGNIDRPTQNYLMAPNSDEILITTLQISQFTIITGYIFSLLNATISLLLT